MAICILASLWNHIARYGQKPLEKKKQEVNKLNCISFHRDKTNEFSH